MHTKNTKRPDRRGIMNAAWAIARHTGRTLAAALRTAWRESKLKAKLAAGTAYFSYLTKDNGIRVAKGTLREDAITYVPNGRGRPTPAHLLLYWDLDRGAYRSFDRANLLMVA